MSSRAIAIAVVLAVVATIGGGMGAVSAQAPVPSSIDGLQSAAKIAAGLDWPGTFMRLCIPPPATGRGGGGGGRGANAQPAGRAGGGATPAPAAPAGPPRELWYAEPAKVADNLYFLGTSVHNAW